MSEAQSPTHRRPHAVPLQILTSGQCPCDAVLESRAAPDGFHSVGATLAGLPQRAAAASAVDHALPSGCAPPKRRLELAALPADILRIISQQLGTAVSALHACMRFSAMQLCASSAAPQAWAAAARPYMHHLSEAWAQP